MFRYECDLVSKFLEVVHTSNGPFISNSLRQEFDYRSGRTDIVIHDTKKQLLSFEAKLKKWRDALHQAYRNSSFSHYSYVLLPSDTSKSALKNIDEFIARKVGLCTVVDDEIKILIKAPFNEPIQPWLTKSAVEFTQRGN